jgi:hypothetical protein
MKAGKGLTSIAILSVINKDQITELSKDLNEIVWLNQL